MKEIYGLRPIIEAIKNEQEISRVFLDKNLGGNLFKQLKDLLIQKKIYYKYVPKERFNRYSDKNHQGAVAIVSPIKFLDLESILEKESEDAKLFLLLDGVTDSRNLGAIIRTANAANIDALILPQTNTAPITEDTIKTSSGALFDVPICKVSHLKDAMFLLKAYDIQIVAGSEKESSSIYQVDFKKSTAIILGSEDIGISKSIIRMANVKASLPMLGSIESLNVSTTCGIMLYEVIRQRKFT